MKRNIYKRILSLIITAVLLVGPSSVFVSAISSELTAVEIFVKKVLDYGRYIEGSEYPELFVDGFNIYTNEPVEWKQNGKTYNQANFFNQQNFLRTLVGLSELTGNDEYKEIAKNQVKLWFDNFTDKNGLLYTGAHTFVDVKSGDVVTTGEYEMKDNTPFYELMYEVDPEATIKYMEAFWNAHILDWSNLNMNRHGAYDKDMDSLLWDNQYTDSSIDINSGEAHAFQSTGNDLIDFAFFISEKTGDKKTEEWALRLLQKYIDVADDTTGLSGAQYGEMESGDRAQLQFGEDFKGIIPKEYNYVNKNKIVQTAGYAPRVLLPYYEGLSDEEKEKKKYILDYVVKSIEGVARFAYDEKNNRLNTPRWSSETTEKSVLQGYTLQRNGEYGNAGTTLPEYENVSPILLTSAIYAHRVSGSEVVWEFARDLAKDCFGLGDIGTAPGVDVEVPSGEITVYSSELVTALLDLYEHTLCKDYLTIAKKIGEKIRYDKRSRDMFLMSNKYVNAKINIGMPLALLRIEAASQGKFDAVPDGETSFGLDVYYDGAGRVSENTVIYKKERVTAQSVCVEEESIVLHLENSFAFDDISGHDKEKEIKQMASVGIVDGRTNTSFMPDEYITRGELIEYCAGACSLLGIEGAKEAGLIDTNLEISGNINPDLYITKEEMASVLAKALMYRLPQNTYKECGALSRFKDGEEVSAWAKTYCDIAANYYLIGKRSEEYFYPKSNVTRADAAISLKKLFDLIGNDAKKLEVTIEPADAVQSGVTYTSNDPTTVETDGEGRLYPIKEGTATIDVTCGSKSSTCVVSVVPYEEYMLKSIKIDGEEIDGFSPTTQSYKKELFIGETQIPQISAESYSGEAVTVILPKILPGVAKIYVEGSADNAYFVSILPEKTDYVLNDDFESYEVGNVPYNVTKDKAVWSVNSNGQANGAAPITMAQHPVTGSRAVKIPYIGNAMQMTAHFSDTPYTVGDDGYIVCEYDLMTEDALPGLLIRLGDYTAATDSTTWAIRQLYNDTSILFGESDAAVVGKYTAGKVHSVKLVINKKTLETDVYFNGTKVLEKQKKNAGVKEIDSFLIKADAGKNANTTLYLDNVKIYELSADADVKSDFYDAQGKSIARIGNEADVSFKKEITLEYTGEVKIIGAFYSPEGTLRKTVCKDTEITSGQTQTLDCVIDVSDMQKGDFLCVYIWTKELCPIIVQKLIYKC